MTNSDEQQIRDLLATYQKSLNTSDAELAASLYTDDGVFMPHSFPTSRKAEVRGAYGMIFDAISLDIDFTIDELVVDGDHGYGLTRSQGTQTVLATNDTTPEANRELFVFAREDGEWKIARYMFNKTSG